MGNFFLDNKDLQFHLNHPLMKKIVELREKNFADKDVYDYAPADFEDAMDSYRRVLEITGGICADVIAANAEDVDKEGPKVVDDHVVYARGTQANLDAIRKAGLGGIHLPRKYEGLNMSLICFVMANEMVARGDAGFENIWGLQDCAETINEFASEEIKQKYLPLVSRGATCAMALTEPDAGSDLQAVMLKAHYDEASGKWLLNGVKRFITNGDGDVSLVLARSEEGTNAPAELVGDRKLGLIKYVMSLMNAARLGIGAQGTGLCEAAYREALKYANERQQFGKPIIQFPAIYEILTNMKAKLYASRAMLYETARFVEIYKCWAEIGKERPLTAEEKTEMKFYNKLADAFTPLCKMFASEYANQLAYESIQIHGGSGYMKDYPIERIYRDARITNIYEGTTQLQVVAAIRHVTTGTFVAQMKEYENAGHPAEFKFQLDKLVALREEYEKAIARVTGGDSEQIEFHARRLVEMTGHIVLSHLLLRQAAESEEYRVPAEAYIKYAQAQNKAAAEFIANSCCGDIDLYKAVLNDSVE